MSKHVAELNIRNLFSNKYSFVETDINCVFFVAVYNFL